MSRRRYPEPINRHDELFWSALKAFNDAEDIAATEDVRTSGQLAWVSMRDRLSPEDRELIQKGRRRPPINESPEVKTWVPMEYAQCPYCYAQTPCSRITPLPKRCPSCYMLIDRREVKE